MHTQTQNLPVGRLRPFDLLFRGEIAVLLRLAIAYGLAVGAVYLASSPLATAIMGRGPLQPEGFGGTPLVILGVLYITFWFFNRRYFENQRLPLPGGFQMFVAADALIIMLLVTFFASHPWPAFYETMDGLIEKNPIWMSIATSTLYVILLMPAPLILPLVFPAGFLSKHRKMLLGLSLLAVLYPYTSVIDTLYHQTVSGVVLGLSASVLTFFSSQVVIVPEKLLLTYRNFTAIIGPACLGMNSILLFIAFFSFIWFRLVKHERFSWKRALVAFVGGIFILFFLNILRIASVMMVGSIAPELALDLFHGAIGAVIFFLVFLAYLKWVVPRLVKGDIHAS